MVAIDLLGVVKSEGKVPIFVVDYWIHEGGLQQSRRTLLFQLLVQLNLFLSQVLEEGLVGLLLEVLHITL